ncbi:hypothetical protein HAX54_000967, partial [Datura stramonium]|nr:hypothetical protein [Datura stramonium]
SSTPTGSSGLGVLLGRGQGRGGVAMPDYAYLHPRIFTLDSQRVTESPTGNPS